MSQKFKRITNAKLHRHRQGRKNSGRDGITQVAETLFSLWSLTKEMHTETRAQNMESGRVVTYYNYLHGVRHVEIKFKLVDSELWQSHYY